MIKTFLIVKYSKDSIKLDPVIKDDFKDTYLHLMLTIQAPFLFDLLDCMLHKMVLKN